MNFEKALNSKLQDLDLGFDPDAWEKVEQKISAEAGEFSSIKNSLNDFNAGYSEQAWANISQKVASNNSTFKLAKTASRFRWIAGVASALVVGFVAYPLLFGETNDPTTAGEIEISTAAIKTETNNKKDISPVEQVSSEVPIEKTSNKQLVVTELKNPNQDIERSSAQPSIQKTTTVLPPELILTKNEFCVGEELTYNVQNSNKHIVVLLNGKKLRSNKKRMTTAGKHQLELVDVSNKKEPKVLSTQELNILTPEELNFSQSRVKSETTEATQFASNNENLTKIAWYNESHFMGNGMAVQHVFTKRGRYQIKMVATDGNGCTDSIVRTVRILKAYNLMATQIYNPEKGTWLPVGLKNPNMDFNLKIIASDGTQAFETSESAKEWDGVNAESGKKAKDGDEYFWVAKVKNELGHVQEYGGSFIVSSKL